MSEGFYLTERELVARGWSSDTLRKAIRSGKLNGVFQGTSFIVREDHLQEWVDLQLPKGRPTGRTAPAAAPAPTGRTAPAPAAGRQTATAEWQERVKNLVAKGTPRDMAVGMVDKTHPGLRQQMIAEANRR